MTNSCLEAAWVERPRSKIYAPSVGTTVRRAEEADADAVVAVDHIPERADDVRRAVLETRCLLAEVDGRVVGFCIAGHFFGYDFLELQVVGSDHRRKGIGTALAKAWEESSRSPKLFTSTNESNLAMQRLCEQLGYVRSGVIENLDEGDPEVIYFKPVPERDV
jgi:ribosomal protein S18 acetylase RimI-like enzyme